MNFLHNTKNNDLGSMNMDESSSILPYGLNKFLFRPNSIFTDQLPIKSFDHFLTFLGFGISHSEGDFNSPRLNFVNFQLKRLFLNDLRENPINIFWFWAHLFQFFLLIPNMILKIIGPTWILYIAEKLVSVHKERQYIFMLIANSILVILSIWVQQPILGPKSAIESEI